MVQSALKKVEGSLAEEQCIAPERAQASIIQYKETHDFKLGLERMGQVSYEYGYRVVLAHFQARHPKLEIEEDPYATLLEEEDVSMESSSNNRVSRQRPVPLVSEDLLYPITCDFDSSYVLVRDGSSRDCFYI
ncbi:hypothetical protein BHM03_00008195 [Ensete ventricosum]|nr:hypothetical protein BHM03_00008195 [Ensete ventricosum]